MTRTGPIDSKAYGRLVQGHAFDILVRVRLLVAPVLGSLALTMALLDTGTWRRAILLTDVVLLIGVSFVEFFRYRRRGIGELTVPLNVLVMAFGQLALTAASGGLFSPVAPAVIIMAVVTSMLVEPKVHVVLVVVVQIVTFWVLAFVHWGGPPDLLVPDALPLGRGLNGSYIPFAFALLYSGMVAAASRLAQSLRSIFETLHAQAIAERERSLALYAEQSRSLSALSAEIAHELKNPMSSVKGLSVLLARRAEGKQAERLEVLRSEVDRMQSILEDLLNFSRPLVPLAIEQVDLVALAKEVATLHEGSAAEREVGLSVIARKDVSARCDPRKVRQALINLVQNAIEASPEGSGVEVHVSLSGRRAFLRVCDRGPGIDPSIADHLFELGTTTKEYGSGIGLVVARGLARQHGGELLLADRQVGGCEAELSIPQGEP